MGFAGLAAYGPEQLDHCAATWGVATQGWCQHGGEQSQEEDRRQIRDDGTEAPSSRPASTVRAPMCLSVP